LKIAAPPKTGIISTLSVFSFPQVSHPKVQLPLFTQLPISVSIHQIMSAVIVLIFWISVVFSLMHPFQFGPGIGAKVPTQPGTAKVFWCCIHIIAINVYTAGKSVIVVLVLCVTGRSGHIKLVITLISESELHTSGVNFSICDIKEVRITKNFISFLHRKQRQLIR